MTNQYKIIFVGGDTNIRAVVAKTLLDAKWKVEPAEDFEEIDTADFGRAVVIQFVEETGSIARIKARMAEEKRWFPVIACTATDDSRLVADSLLAGAQGHLLWPFEAGELQTLLSRRRQAMDAYVAEQQGREESRAKVALLSGREREVLQALVRLGSNKRIAAELDLSPRTVEIYRSKIMQRLGVQHIAQAIWIAYESGQFGANGGALRHKAAAFPDERGSAQARMAEEG